MSDKETKAKEVKAKESKAGQAGIKESKAVRFLGGVKAEFMKVIWPEPVTMMRQMVAVLAVSIIAGLLISVIDFGVQNLIELLTTI